jgi:DUF1365 family protein
MNSALYIGDMTHRRLRPRRHEFGYRLFMVYLDLSELDAVFAQSSLWSIERRNIVSFRRADHMKGRPGCLDAAVRDAVAEKAGRRPNGRICLLTHLRYFGYCMNPVSFYFIWNEAEDGVEFIVGEVNNTPWGEQHLYVLENPDSASHDALVFDFPKSFHVSPFMGMAQDYHWRFTLPGSSLSVSMANREERELQFTATMDLERLPLTKRTMFSVLLQFPFMTGKIIAGIYWQALKLRLKKTPFHPHPDSNTPSKDGAMHVIE